MALLGSGCIGRGFGLRLLDLGWGSGHRFCRAGRRGTGCMRGFRSGGCSLLKALLYPVMKLSRVICRCGRRGFYGVGLWLCGGRGFAL